MNNIDNEEGNSSQASVVFHCSDANRPHVSSLLVRIREILDRDFDSITYDESNIDNLLQLIDEVAVWKHLLTDVEFGFFIALRFFVDNFSSDMKHIDNALATLTAVQQECDVTTDDFNDADNQRTVNANAIK